MVANLEGAGARGHLTRDLRLGVDRVAFAEALGLELDNWQAGLLASSSSRTLLNCCRQSGKSTMAAIIALHRALYFPGSLVLCLAPALRQAQELFTKLAEFYAVLGEPMKRYGERRLSLELTNGSRVVALPGSERTIRGYSGAAILLVDEAARVEDALYYAIRPMLSVSQGSLIMLSTPWGKRGVFHHEWTEGTGWSRYEVPATEVPRISETFLEEERRSFPARVFRQEYLCSFEETEDQVFSYADIKRSIDPEVLPVFIPGALGGDQ
jgi:hypothetical protein